MFLGRSSARRLARRPWPDAKLTRDRDGVQTLRIVRAISIRQPYAEQILRRLKPEEFRSINTRIRKRVWIYASERPADDPAAWRSMRKRPTELPTGVIVGSVVIVSVRTRANGDFAYKLAAPKRVSRQKRPRNQPVFWRPKVLSQARSRRLQIAARRALRSLLSYSSRAEPEILPCPALSHLLNTLIAR